MDRLVKAGYKYTVDVDLKSYFDTIPHDRLVQDLRKHVADNSVIGLVEKFLQAEVLDGLEHWTPTTGAPQGAIISPLLSNLYLNELGPLRVVSRSTRPRRRSSMWTKTVSSSLGIASSNIAGFPGRRA